MTKRHPGIGAAPGSRWDHRTPPAKPEYLRQTLEHLIEGLGHVVPERHLLALQLLVNDAREARAIAAYRRRRL